MITPRLFLKLTFFICGILVLAGCEGGNSKSTSCAAGEVRGEYGNCIKPPASCPQGETVQNGQCKPGGLSCPPGQHIENNQCVVDTIKCPTGEVEQDGQCVPIPLQCPDGQHEENGECVPDTITCPTNQVPVDGECVPNILHITINDQTACWSDDGTTHLELKYLVRDASGKTIDPVFNSVNAPTVLSTELFVNGRPLDVEAQIDYQSELLHSDLVLSMVLDSTYSMLEHSPPAFTPMKSAAAAILRRTQDIWEVNGSLFHWELAWFNTLIYRPLENNAGETWEIDDLADIPEPGRESYTGLYKAVSYMAGVHRQLYRDGVADGERDQHVMIIFTDGDDNYSYLDNSDEENRVTGSYDDTLFWEGFGYPATRKDTLPAQLSATPNLKTFVIGFGERVIAQNLIDIAQGGNGRYFYGDKSANLASLFDTVSREFITELTLTAKMPLEPNEYTFTLEAQHRTTGVEGQFDFDLTVSPTALPSCPESVQ